MKPPTGRTGTGTVPGRENKKNPFAYYVVDLLGACRLIKERSQIVGELFIIFLKQYLCSQGICDWIHILLLLFLLLLLLLLTKIKRFMSHLNYPKEQPENGTLGLGLGLGLGTHIAALSKGRTQLVLVMISLAIAALVVYFERPIADLYTANMPLLFENPANKYSVQAQKGFDLKFSVVNRVASLDNLAELNERATRLIENSNLNNIQTDHLVLKEYFDINIVALSNQLPMLRM